MLKPFDEAQAEAEKNLAALRTAMGPAGREVRAQTYTLDAEQSVAAAADASSLPGAGVSSGPPAPSGTAAAQEAQIAGMAADALIEATPLLNERLALSEPIDPQAVRALVATIGPRPDGFAWSLEDELQHHPPDVRTELQALHALAWRTLEETGALPASVVALEHRYGYRNSPKFFALLVRLGSAIRDRQERSA